MPARQKKRPASRRLQRLSITAYPLPTDEAVRTVEREMFSGRFVDEYLSALLARASMAVSTEFNADMGRVGTPIHQWRILASLSDSPGLSLSDVAELTLIKQPTLTRLVQRLEKRGLLRKVVDRKDRRLVRLSLTARGRDEVKGLIRIAMERQKHILHGLDAEALIAALRHLIAFCAAKRRYKRLSL